MERETCRIVAAAFDRQADFSKQFFRTYCVRLERSSALVTQRAAERAGGLVEATRLCDVAPGERALVIGTLYKEMEHKPSVIKELTDSHQLNFQTINCQRQLTSDTDQLFLEDSQSRIHLRIDQSTVSRLVTGIVVGLLGRESETTKGEFIVEDIIYATPRFPRHVKGAPGGHGGAQYIAVLSGLRLGALDSGDSEAVSVQLLLDWLSGALPLSARIEPRRVGRLIIAGDSLDGCTGDGDHRSAQRLLQGERGLALLDRLLADVCRSIPVDLVPGRRDPTSILLPQKPLHRALFPRARCLRSFQTRPNPFVFQLDTVDNAGGQECVQDGDSGAWAVVSAGQPTGDIARLTSIEREIDRMAATVEWGHLAPSAPDTLPSYPNEHGCDPLALQYRPSVYISGNQSELSWENVEYEAEGGSTLFVTVPCFHDTKEIVLVDMVNKCCHSLSFKTS